MPIDWKDTPHIGGMKPWACSYDKGGVRHGITLYGTSPDQVLEDNCDSLYGLTVDGEINALRLKAFATNSHDDRMAYYKACSGWFQDEDYRELERADEITALRARLAEVTEERNVQNDLRQIAEDAADDFRARAEAALATARRDAQEEAAQVSSSFGCCHVPDEIAAAIRALKDQTP